MTLAAAVGRSPDEQEVAEHFAANPELQIVAGLHGRRTAAELLRYRADILALLDSDAAVEPAGATAAEPPAAHPTSLDDHPLPPRI